MKIGVFPGECLDGKSARSALASLQGTVVRKRDWGVSNR